jgi:hypothetical protein
MGVVFDGYSFVSGSNTEKGFASHHHRIHECGACRHSILCDQCIWSTKESQHLQTSRSYSGYSEFWEEVKEHVPDIYLPLTMDSVIPSDLCQRVIDGLDKVRHHFVLDTWKPLDILDGDRIDEDLYDCDHRDDHDWFFREFYRVFYLGAQSGVVVVS